ncbi:MAG: cbb3-type cytochrome c oxidase subunit II [Verrucomicrobia bacterium]|nr:cbb3-type cytochrome c oxidase subunit II [Verrucomicrobiota bacterium]
MVETIPQPILQGVAQNAADAAAKALNEAGAQAEVKLVPLGPDIARNWGPRRTVAQDYLYDYPVLLGSQRIGPDLINVGLRLPSEEWHLSHLYNPRMLVPNSTMPPYRFLFEKRKIGRQASPEALKLSGKFAPPSGYEVVPTTKAKTLVAFLLNQRIEASLFEAPFPQSAANPVADASTNAPATNVPAGATTNSPAK